MSKTRLATLEKMDEGQLRAWLRKAWDAEYPNQVTAYFDEWEARMWSRVAFRKDLTGMVERDAFLAVKESSRRITHTTHRQAPYQACRP